jgi:hypothetical protein
MSGKEDSKQNRVPKCRECGYEKKGQILYEGYCFQCAVDKGITTNPLDLSNGEENVFIDWDEF